MSFFVHAGQWLAVMLLVGAPVALAWWLSDGFAGFMDWPAGGATVTPAVNPHTGQPGLVVRDPDSGAPVAYTD